MGDVRAEGSGEHMTSAAAADRRPVGSGGTDCDPKMWHGCWRITSPNKKKKKKKNEGGGRGGGGGCQPLTSIAEQSPVDICSWISITIVIIQPL